MDKTFSFSTISASRKFSVDKLLWEKAFSVAGQPNLKPVLEEEIWILKRLKQVQQL
jgi:hypothetical protein